MHIQRQRSPRKSTAAWLAAARAAGYPTERANLPEPKGFTETMVSQNNGSRWSTADGYLKPALARKNLELVTEALATKVIFDGHRGVGVQYEKGGKPETVTARREVILCGGAVNTGFSRIGPITTAWPYGSPRPSLKNGAGAKMSSRSGSSRPGRLRTNPYASATLDVSMPRRRTR